ncbi:MAG TPA: hypothetical protein V6D48_23010, partial [Oculatellaceae cyanobacterium]
MARLIKVNEAVFKYKLRRSLVLCKECVSRAHFHPGTQIFEVRMNTDPRPTLIAAAGHFYQLGWMVG